MKLKHIIKKEHIRQQKENQKEKRRVRNQNNTAGFFTSKELSHIAVLV